MNGDGFSARVDVSHRLVTASDVTTACVFQHLISSFPAAGLRCLYPMLHTTRSHDNGQLLAAPTTGVPDRLLYEMGAHRLPGSFVPCGQI